MWLGPMRPRSQCVGGVLLAQRCSKHVLDCLKITRVLSISRQVATSGDSRQVATSWDSRQVVTHGDSRQVAASGGARHVAAAQWRQHVGSGDLPGGAVVGGKLLAQWRSKHVFTCLSARGGSMWRRSGWAVGLRTICPAAPSWPMLEGLFHVPQNVFELHQPRCSA